MTMTKRMLVDATHPEEIRVAIVQDNKLIDLDIETSSREQIKGNIYLARVSRVEPSLQAAFIDFGGGRQGFLSVNDIHPKYYPTNDKGDRGEYLPLPLPEPEDDEEDGEFDYDDDEDDEEEEESPPVTGKGAAAASSGGDGSSRSRQPVMAERRARTHTECPEVKSEPVAGTESRESSDLEAGTDTVSLVDSAEAEVSSLGGSSTSDGSETNEASVSPHDAEAAEESGEARLPASPEESDVSEHSGTVDASGESDESDESEGAGTSGESEDFGASDESGEFGDRGEAEESERAGNDSGPDELDGGVEIDEDGAPLLDTFKRFPRRQRLPIQKILTRGQKLLVQVVKEPRGNKGASLTTNLSLAGRYAVLLPENEGGGGISRKITDGVERKKLKEILETIAIPGQVSLIIRTAGLGRTKREIIRDLNYLLRLWKKILDNAGQADGPMVIHEEGDLIMRTIRDLYSSDMNEILIEGHEGYRRGKDFMRLLMPRYMKVVQPYKETQPIFSRFQIENQIESMHERIIQLKSGGYIVIEPTEAMVTIDINSGRSTREKDVETTAFKTNLQATEEIARQLRLRDLGGLIVIDFIDMEDKKHNLEVERQMRESLKLDRAKIQLGKISQFGLLELSRQRMKPTFSETNRMECPRCKGLGTIRSVESTAIHLFRMLEEDVSKNRYTRIVYRTSWDVANYLLNHKRAQLTSLEVESQIPLLIQGDESLQTPEYRVERIERPRAAPLPDETTSEQKSGKSAVNSGRPARNNPAPAVQENARPNKVDSRQQPPAPATTSAPEEEEENETTAAPETAEKKKRRRRRRRKSASQTAPNALRPGETLNDAENGEEGEDEEEELSSVPGIQGVQATEAPGLFILARPVIREPSKPVKRTTAPAPAVPVVTTVASGSEESEAGEGEEEGGAEEEGTVSAEGKSRAPRRRRRRRSTAAARRASAGEGGEAVAVESATGEEEASEVSPQSETSADVKPEELAEEPPVQVTIEEPPVQVTIEESPVQATIEEPPVQVTIEEPPAQAMIEEPPVQAMIEEPPAQPTIEEPPVQPIEEKKAPQSDDLSPPWET
ncbi:MAG: Rne/Rng family ribonuclease [Magnetococcales bacterium]|nr:Rne/Rng family ribonuclease [Magnetococcales bacterium]